MTSTSKSARGFTIVELLIVIVIIAILAAITIVAYNGIQNRAKTSAAQSAASTLAKKAETFYAENSQYPNTAGIITSTTHVAQGSIPANSTTTSSSWYSAPGGAFATTASTTFTSATAAPSNPRTIYYVPNGTNGGCAYYRDFGGNDWEFVLVGTATCTSGGPATNATSVAL